MDDDVERRRAERVDRADEHRKAHVRRREQEAAKAQSLIDRFVGQAVEAGLPPEELTARPWSGRGRYHIGVTGWYLRTNHSIGVGRDGGFYVLNLAPVRFGRWRTVRLDPSPPPLIVGEGGRDGESVPLETLLQLRLEW